MPGLLQLLTDDGGLLDGPLPGNQLPVSMSAQPVVKATFLELKPAELFEQQLQEAEQLQELECSKFEQLTECKPDQQPPDLLALITDSLGLAAYSPLAPLSPEDVESCVSCAPSYEAPSYESMYDVAPSPSSSQYDAVVCPVSMYDSTASYDATASQC